MSKGISS